MGNAANGVFVLLALTWGVASTQGLTPEDVA
jgi:hypothetical protein